MPINQQVMDPETIQRMAYEMLTPEQIERFETTGR
jgi:twitching motility protein PilU